MLFNTLEIRPSGDTWEIAERELDHERVDSEGSMSGLGFYHYPRDLGREEAFTRLQKHMAEAHLAEVERLMKSLKALLDLKLPAEEIIYFLQGL